MCAIRCFAPFPPFRLCWCSPGSAGHKAREVPGRAAVQDLREQRGARLLAGHRLELGAERTPGVVRDAEDALQGLLPQEVEERRSIYYETYFAQRE